jgi:hypothetical protein
MFGVNPNLPLNFIFKNFNIFPPCGGHFIRHLEMPFMIHLTFFHPS